ncbi:hypothetical protein F8388_015932 [Cannabis sativa]|uniref:Uncharacterized protein n=1 Tax=Cannabis sativa TaxID=3483 RepID=A0A7J6EF73_CANSA|nr:hypothetical protein F8388_015932 [Cannabis sativa]
MTRLHTPGSTVQVVKGILQNLIDGWIWSIAKEIGNCGISCLGKRTYRLDVNEIFAECMLNFIKVIIITGEESNCSIMKFSLVVTRVPRNVMYPHGESLPSDPYGSLGHKQTQEEELMNQQHMFIALYSRHTHAYEGIQSQSKMSFVY